MGTEASVRDRAQAAYRRITDDDNPRGFQVWFRRELQSRGVEASDPTVTRWFQNGVPVDRIVEVDDVLILLEEEAIVTVADRLRDGAAELVEQLEAAPFQNVMKRYTPQARAIVRDIDEFIHLTRR